MTTEAEAWAALGRRVERARLRAKLSRREMARQLGVSEGHLRHLEHGGYRTRQGVLILPTHSDETITAIADFLGLDARRLLRLVDPERFVPAKPSPTIAALIAENERLRKEVDALRAELDERR